MSPAAPAYVPANAKDATTKIVLVGEDENVEGINFSLVLARTKLRRAADAKKTNIELKPCQNLTDYQVKQ